MSDDRRPELADKPTQRQFFQLREILIEELKYNVEERKTPIRIRRDNKEAINVIIKERWILWARKKCLCDSCYDENGIIDCNDEWLCKECYDSKC